MGLGSSREAAPPTIGLLPTAPTPEGGGGTTRLLISIVGGFILLYIGYRLYNYIQARNGFPGLDFSSWISPTGGAKSSGSQVSTPLDGKVRMAISSSDVPSDGGVNYSVQYWMYIADWDYKFGQEKDILKRVAANNTSVVGPRIFLSPTDNTLNVRVSLFSADGTAGAATPGAETTGDSQTCSVENVPLQSWFSVSVTVFQRNLDIYINGRLVKSCVLTGIPRPATGDMILNDNGGFSGTICNVDYYNTMLAPSDAKEFFSKGTLCAGTEAGKNIQVDKNSLMITLFGYTFRFSTLTKEGTELSSYTL